MDAAISKGMRKYNRLLGELNGTYHEAAVKLGLSDSVMAVLYTLCSEGSPCPLQEIVRQSGASKQTINSAIRKLEGGGAVCLEAARGRSKCVRLTVKGRELVRQTVVPLMKLEDEIYTSWSGEELRTYLELTERFLTALREKMKGLEERTL